MRIATILIVSILIMGSGCSLTVRPSVNEMAILNDRLTKIEKEIKTRPNHHARRVTPRGEKLTEAQKEFIELIMDYLNEKK